MSRIASIFRTFLKFGCVTFGGGWSIVAQIQKEYVEEKHWISNEELLDFTSVARSMPGIMICNTSVIFGYQMAGIPGAVAALTGIAIPPFLIMLLVTNIYEAFRANVYVASAMIGVRASVVPIIISAIVRLFRSGMKDGFCYLLAGLSLGLSLFTGISRVIIVLLGALAGILYEGRKDNGHS